MKKTALLLFGLKGSITRRTFWLGLLTVIGLIVGLFWIVVLLEFLLERTPISMVGTVLGPIYLLLVVSVTPYTLVVLCAKRTRDMGSSAWFGLMVLIPAIGFIYLLFIGTVNRSRSGPRQHAASPDMTTDVPRAVEAQGAVDRVRSTKPIGTDDTKTRFRGWKRDFPRKVNHAAKAFKAWGHASLRRADHATVGFRKWMREFLIDPGKQQRKDAQPGQAAPGTEKETAVEAVSELSTAAQATDPGQLAPEPPNPSELRPPLQPVSQPKTAQEIFYERANAMAAKSEKDRKAVQKGCLWFLIAVCLLFTTCIVCVVAMDVEENEGSVSIVPPDVRTAAIASMESRSLVRDASISQSGNTVSLAIVVGHAANEQYARELGDNFVRLMKGLSVDASPGVSIGTGRYDYLISVSYPNGDRIAFGAKSRGSDRIRW